MPKYWTSWSWDLYRKLSAGLAGGRKGVTGAHSSAQLTIASMLPPVPLPPLGTPHRLLPPLGTRLWLPSTWANVLRK